MRSPISKTKSKESTEDSSSKVDESNKSDNVQLETG